MKVAIIRGSYFNKFEMQNYEPLAKKHKLVGFSGLKAIQQNFAFPVVRLFSPIDLPNFPYKLAILNRLCLGDAMYLKGLEEQLKRFTIAHVRETYFHFTQQALNAKAKGYVKKVVCTCSETIPFNHQGIWGRIAFKKRALKEVDLFHCLTNKAKECLIKEGCDVKKIVVFPYGIDLNKFTKRKQLTINNQQSTINILFVGRLVKEKGIYDLLKAFVQLRKKYQLLRLSIVGDGAEKDNLSNLINRVRLNKFITMKQVRYEQTAQEYQHADIFCLLSKPTKYWEEYFGMAVIEAMACGLAIVTTRCGGIPEVVGDSAMLVKPDNWQAAAKTLAKLIENYKLRRLLGVKAVKRAKQMFDCQKTAKNINKLWQKTLN